MLELTPSASPVRRDCAAGGSGSATRHVVVLAFVQDVSPRSAPRRGTAARFARCAVAAWPPAPRPRRVLRPVSDLLDGHTRRLTRDGFGLLPAHSARPCRHYHLR